MVVSAVVYRCDLMYMLIKLHTRGCVGSRIRLATCVSIRTLRYVLPNGHTTSQTDLTAYTATALHHMRQKYHQVVSS